jgi:hypothetical protein
METKICTKCGKEKEVSEFYKDNNQKSGLRPDCKDCCRFQHKKYYDNNIDKINKIHKIYYLNNKEKISKYRKNHRLKNIDKYKNKEKQYRDNHKKEHKILQKKWYQKHKKERQNKNHLIEKERLINDLNFKLRKYLRTRIYVAIKRNLKSKHTSELLGCSVDDLKKHLESQFKEGMSWDNYCFRGWHIDHIKPCASFDLSKPEEQAKCFHYSNLQPLWWYENLSKSKEKHNA